MVKSSISALLLFVESVGVVLDRVEVLDDRDCEDGSLNGKVVSVEMDEKAVALNPNSVAVGRDGEAAELKL